MPKVTLHGLLAPFLLFFGIAFWIGGWQLHERAVDSRAWPSTEGKVIESRVLTVSGTSNRFRPKVLYLYTTAGTVREGRAIGIDDPGNVHQNRALAVAARYPVGKQVQVYYDPDDPADCVLEPGDTLFAWLSLGAAGVFSWFILHWLTRMPLVARLLRL